MPVTADEVHRFAAPLPRTEVAMVRDSMKFRVRSIVYLAISADEQIIGFAFPKAERAALVASEPAKFHLPRESDMRFNWVQAWLAALDRDEMQELVLDAWQMVVPKKVVAAYLATDPIRRAAREGEDH
jgi:hypothetical protein